MKRGDDLYELPQQVRWLLQQFKAASHSCYLVGGCVRDFLSGRDVHDYDFATDALPEEMIHFLSEQPCQLIDTGIKYGTLIIIYRSLRMEVTTYRTEQAYYNHRTPKHFHFTDDLTADLARRDFTINAIAYHPDIGLIDPFHGQADLHKQIIRCVGNSEQRMQEDALRILRAIRFHFTLNFSLDPACEAAVIKNASLLKHISQERIQAEFQKMLMSDTLDLLHKLLSFQVLSYIVPGIREIVHITQESKWHCYDVFTHTDIALNNTSGFSLIEKLAVVFHDFGKAHCKHLDSQGNAHFPNHQAESCYMAKQALYEMKYPKQMIQEIVQLIALHDDYIKADEIYLRRLLAKLDMNYETAFSLIRIQYADACAKNPVYAENQLQILRQSQKLLHKIKQSGFSIKRSDLAVNGNDMIKLGYRGHEIKEVLDWLYEQVIDQCVNNQKNALLTHLKLKK